MKKSDNSRNMISVLAIAFALVLTMCCSLCGCRDIDEPEQKADISRNATMVLPLDKGTEWDVSQDNEIFDIKGEKTDEGMTYTLKPLEKGKCKVTFTCKKGDKALYKVTQSYRVNVDMQAGYIDQKVETIEDGYKVPEIGAPYVEY